MTPPAKPSPVVLETERLTLRHFTDTDADGAALVELDSDPEVMRYIGSVAISDVAAYRERVRTVWMAHYSVDPPRGAFALETKAAGEFLGWVFLRPATVYKFAAEAGWTRPTDLEVGYRLRRAAWGKGYATEAALALVRLALADPAVSCVVAAALVPNRASTRVMEKCGLSRVREFAIPGFDVPSVMYAACRDGHTPS